MKKKVVVIIPSLRGGGAEKVMINVVSALDRNKFDITLIVIKKEGPYIDLVPKDIHLIDIGIDRVRNSIYKLLKTLNCIKPDVILSTQSHLNLSLLMIKPMLKGRPKVIVREANTPSKDMESLTNIKKSVYKMLYKYLYNKADYIIAQCEDMKLDMVQYLKLNEEDITCIYNPLDIEKIKTLRGGKNPYSKNKINLLSVGRLCHQKGFDILIEAFKLVNEEIPNTHLTILGEGNLKDKLQKQIGDLGLEKNISLIDFKKNPYPYYYYSDMYILSSRWEGFPNTLLEALACETKVVSINCKSGPREILADGKYGEIIDSYDSIELAKGIVNYISMENRTQFRADDFSINNIIKNYEDILIL